MAKRMAQSPKIESIGSIGSIVLGMIGGSGSYYWIVNALFVYAVACKAAVPRFGTNHFVPDLPELAEVKYLPRKSS